MTKRRLFIAINLPEEVKRKLAEWQGKMEIQLHPNHSEINWVRKDNLHITLVFLGSVNDEGIVEICKITKEIAEKHSPFLVNFKKISYGPPGKTPPRMIWVEGEKSKELGKLQQDLENSLGNANLGKTEAREYTLHLTLGRIKEWEFRKIEPEERPEINEEVSLSFEVNSIEVMESELKRAGPEYCVLESASLKS